MLVYHTIEPIYFNDSKVLILGSMPSIKSREKGFYYMHPQNRFWSTLSRVYNESIGISIKDKIKFLKKHKIALFDVIKSCEITSSSDTSIKNVVPNDLTNILKNSQITTIFTTGKKATKLYEKYIYPKTNIKTHELPSTSPANCPKNIENKLFETYSEIKKITN